MTNDPATAETYHALLDAIDEGFIVIEVIEDEAGDPIDYRFLEANPAFARQTGLVNAMGRTVRELVPDLEQHWYEAYGRIARTRQPQRFENRADDLGRWYDVYAFAVGQPEDRRVAVLFRDVTERERADMALRDSEARYRAFVNASSDAVYRMNADWTEMRQLDGAGFGLARVSVPRADWRELYVDPIDLPLVNRVIEDAIASKQMIEVEHRTRRPDGTRGWALSRAVPMLGPDGEITEWLGTARDITGRKDAEAALRDSERQMHDLLAELQHRVRNILTVVRSAFTRTVAAGGSVEQIVDHFRGRLDSLARTQVITMRNAGGLVDLESMIRDELLSAGVTDGAKLSLEGPEVALAPKMAQGIGLAIHELTTNAVKYGAIEVSDAGIDIRWALNMDCAERPILRLTWTERGVPAVPVTAIDRGFGAELIEEALPYQIGAVTALEFLPGGVRCTIELPLNENGEVSDTFGRT